MGRDLPLDLPLELGPKPRSAGPGLVPGLDRAWERAQGSSGLWPRLQGLGAAHDIVSALFAMHVIRQSVFLYVIFFDCLLFDLQLFCVIPIYVILCHFHVV